MDAIRLHEWSLFPLLAKLNERAGYFLFTGLHIPLYLLLFWNLFGKNGVNENLMMGLNIFFIIHLFLHLLFLRHPKNQFTSPFSWILILGAGIAGVVDLLVQV